MSVLRFTFVAAVLAALAMGCSSNAAKPRTSGATTAATSTSTSSSMLGSSKLYVVPRERAAGFYGEKADAFFTPDQTIISALEGALPMFLGSSTNPRAQTITPKLDGYKRQYVGVVIEGQKMIHGNFFCSAKMSVKKPQFVDDGGACFFTVLFDISSRTFPKLEINGDA